MAANPVLAAGFITNVLATIFVIGSVALILVVLIQKGKGGGLSGAFAGGMASGILGSKTGDVLTWITISMASLFIIVALVLDKWWRPSTSGPASRTPAPITSNDTGRGTDQPAPAPADQQGQNDKQ
ncbi:MAG: preprotein translocase subunit SecG [Sedimentisphaerales bacterium]|jgi:preprotein translocase subunit SecG